MNGILEQEAHTINYIIDFRFNRIIRIFKNRKINFTNNNKIKDLLNFDPEFLNYF